MCQQCETGGMTRRSLFVAGAAAAVATRLGSAAAWAAEAGPAVSPDEALQRLVQGNARYAANTATNKDFSAGRAARALGQAPFAAILSCAHSRVAPEIAFDQGPGDIFVVRVAGNFVNEDGLASLEYGASVLGIGLILVLGHSSCGAVSATIKAVQEGVVLPGHLPGLVDAIRPAVETAIASNPADLLVAATADNVRHNVTRLETAQPILADLVTAGKLKVAGGVYNIATGTVDLV